MANLIGQNLGPYRIIEQIGRGGMATVYKAYQPSMDRYVAVKVLPAHFMQDPAFVERFEREARTIAKLEHPHILPVFDYGEATNGITYIAMRYVEAGTLADLLHQKPPLLPEVFRLFDQMADALAYAHEQGVIHRDIKPSNMLVDSRGQIFLTDFGLARMMEGTSNLTGSMILGTPAYMAPELGEGRPADRLSDIYALGVVLYEMATGRPPFEAETPMAVMLKHMTDPLPLPRQINPDIPESLEQVILKALAKDPADRYQSVSAMIEAVRSLPHPAPPPTVAGATLPKVSIPEPTPVPQLAAPAKKLPAWGRWAIAGVGVVVLVAALIVLLTQSDEGKPLPEPVATVIVAVAPTDSPPPTSPPPTADAASSSPTAVPAAVDVPPGWTLFTNTDNVTALALQGDVLWAGTAGGLVAWDYRNFTYQKFTVADGMPYHTITALAVDDDGALWAGTDSDGILRFDGQTWQQFTDEDGLASNTILTLFKSNTGVILAGSAYGEGGLNYFEHGEWEPSTIPPELIEFPSPIAIAETSVGERLVALADGGGLLYSGDGENWARLTTEDGLPSNNLVSMALGADDSLWLSTDERGGVGLYDGTTFYPIDELADYLVTALYVSPDGVMWIGTDDQVLLAFDGEQLQPYGEDDGLPYGAITSILQDDEGILWLGMDGSGLVRFERERPAAKFDMWQVVDESAFNRAQQILETPDGRLWFVPLWGGNEIAVYDPRTDAWDSVFTPNEEDAYAVAIEPEGAIWFGTGNGLWRVAPSGAKKHFTTDDGLPGNAITALAIDAVGGLWVGTETGLAYHNPADTDVPWRDFSGALAAKYIEMFYVDSEGEIWIGTQGNDGQSAQLLWAADTIYGTWGSGNPFADSVEIIESATMDSEGRLWVGTWGGPGVYRLDEKSQDGLWQMLSAEDGAPEGEIIAMAAQSNGPVWFGTWYHGLWNFDPVDGWRHITPADGLPGWAVFSMHVASNGSVWVSTEGGIGRYTVD